MDPARMDGNIENAPHSGARARQSGRKHTAKRGTRGREPDKQKGERHLLQLFYNIQVLMFWFWAILVQPHPLMYEYGGTPEKPPGRLYKHITWNYTSVGEGG